MHYLYFAKVSKEEAKTSEEARDFAESRLQQEGFCDDGGYFSGSKGDWFVIGGRWSGELSSLLLGKKFYGAVRKKYKGHEGISEFGFSHKFIEDEKEGIQKIWEELGGKDKSPLDRDQYVQQGFEDDAMIITKELLEAFKKQKKDYSDVEMFDTEHLEEYPITELKKESIGSWLVVVDYHS